jgi:hypothetical protein
MTESTPVFQGMLPWRPGTEIIEVATEEGRVDLHNNCVLLVIEIRIEQILPTLALKFRHDSGKSFELAFNPVLDLTVIQDPDDWHAYLRGIQWDTGESSTFFGIDFWTGPDDLSRFTVNSMLGHVHFKAPLVRWSGGQKIT